YATFRQEAVYADDVSVQTYQTYLGKRERHTTITPVTRQMNYIYLRSSGEDGIEGTADDFSAAAFSRFSFEESATASLVPGNTSPTILSGSTGAISGIVVDASGAVIPGSAVRARQEDSGQIIDTTTDDAGRYVLRNLPAGQYTIEIFKE